MDKTATKYSMPRVKGSQLSCTLVGVLSVLFNLRNTAVLLHGTTGCAHYGQKFCQQMLLREREIFPDFRPPNLNFRTTALSENELIFGGEDRLCDRIMEMLDAFPGLPLMVVPSCTVEVIGDDVNGICDRMSRKTGRSVVCFNMGGFLKGDHYEGINSAYFDLINRFLIPSSRTEPGSVNLVAERSLMPASDMDFMEVKRLLGLLGLDINARFVHNLPFEDLSGVTRAALNLPAIQNQSIAVCERMHEKFDIPFVREGFPSGFEDTRNWLLAIKEALCLSHDIDALIAKEKSFFLREIDRLGNPFKGLKLIVNSFPIHMGWLNEFLDLIGVDLLEVNILDTGYFQKEFMDTSDGLERPIQTHMSLEQMLENNSRKKADLYLQCSVHYSPIPNHQPGLLIKEIPVIPPVGPRGLLNLFVNWAQWIRSSKVEGWRNERL